MERRGEMSAPLTPCLSVELLSQVIVIIIVMLYLFSPLRETLQILLPYCGTRNPKNISVLYIHYADQLRLLGNCPPTPPPSQH